MVVDQVLPDRHRVPAATQRLRNQLAVRLAGARARRRPGGASRRWVGGHRPRSGRFCARGVGGHLVGGGRFWRPVRRPPALAHRNPGRLQIAAIVARSTPVASSMRRTRPSQSPQRQNLLLFVIIQDIAGPRYRCSLCFDGGLLILRTNRSLQGHLSVLGDDFDVMSVCGERFVGFHRFANLTSGFQIRFGVGLLIRGHLRSLTITVINARIVWLYLGGRRDCRRQL